MLVNKKNFKLVVSGIVVVCSVLGTSACKKEGPLEKAGKSTDQTIEDAGDAAERATDNAGEAIENAGDKLDRETSH